MAESIADLAAHLGVNVDKSSFASARAALDRLAKVEMAKVIEQANATARAVQAAIGTKIPEAAKKAEMSIGGLWSRLRSFWLIEKGLQGFTGLKHMAEHAIHVGAEMGDLADKTGLAVEEIQEFGYAAQIHGLSTGFMANTLNKLAISVDKAAKKGGELAEPFRKAGIAIKDAEGKARPAGDVMSDVADHLATLSQEERPAAAMKLLGKAGKELIPLLKDGSKGLNDLRQEARDMGLVMSKETVDAMDKVQKNTLRLSKAWEGIKEHAIAALIPEIKKLTESLLAWYSANKEDIAHVVHEVFHLILIVVKNLAKGLMLLIKIGAMLAKSWKAITVVLVAAAAAYTILNRKAVAAGMAMFKAGLKAAAGWVVAAAPLIALTALIAGIILAVQDFHVWMKGGKSVMGDMFGKFEDNPWAQSLAQAFDKVVDAVKFIVDKVAWVVEKALQAHSLITGGPTDHVKQDPAFKKLREQGMSEAQAMVETVNKGASYQKAFQQTMVPEISIPASSDATAGLAPVTVNTTNTINVTGGDPEKMKQAAQEVLDKNNRQLEATIGGAKRK